MYSDLIGTDRRRRSLVLVGFSGVGFGLGGMALMGNDGFIILYFTFWGKGIVKEMTC